MKRNGEKKTGYDVDGIVKGGGSQSNMADSNNGNGARGGSKVGVGVAGESHTLATAPESQTISRGSHDREKDDSASSPAAESRSGQQSPDRISYVHTGNDVDDVVRSGIVSRILASVNGRVEDLDTKSAASQRSPNGAGKTPESPQKGSAASPNSTPLYPSSSGATSTAINTGKTSTTAVSGNKATSGGGAKLSTAITSPVPPSSASNRSSNNTASNQNASILASSVIDVKQASPVGDSLRPAQPDPHNSSQRSGQKGEGRSISVVDIKKAPDGNGGGKRAKSSVSSGLQPSSDSSKSTETNNQQGQTYPRYSGDYSPLSAREKGTYAADIPQSLSADSGIGSPTDAGLGIDPEGGSPAEGSEDGKWKGKITAAGPSAAQIATPHLPDRSDNYRPCIEQGDAPSLSSHSDTSNYLPASETSDRQSFHGSRFWKHDGDPENSLVGTEKRNPEVKAGAPDDVKEVNSQNSISSVPAFTSHKATNLEQDTTSLPEDRSTSTNTHISKTSANNGKYSSEQETAKSSSVIDVEKTSPVIQTLHTTEFTIETDSGVAKNAPDQVLPSSTPENKRILQTSTAGFQPNGPTGDIESDSCIANGSVQRTANHIDEQGSLKNQTVTSSEGEEVKDGEAVVFSVDETSDPEKQVPEKPQRKKPTFKAVSLQEVIALSDSPNSDSKIKGILKTKSAPSLASKIEKPVANIGARNGVAKDGLSSSRSVSFKKTHTKSTFSYYNAAFEGEIITEPSKRPSLADVVSQIMRQNSIIDIDDDNSHPYGRDSSLTDLMTGKRRENYTYDAGKMIVWLALAIMIVSLAGGIIFMSETYNMHRDGQGLALPETVDTTTPKISS